VAHATPVQLLLHGLVPRCQDSTALGKEAFADRIFAERAWPRAALGKGFAESLRGFAESLGPSAKQPAPVVLALSSPYVVVLFVSFFRY
jgi:hypothetical protein